MIKLSPASEMIFGRPIGVIVGLLKNNNLAIISTMSAGLGLVIDSIIYSNLIN